MGKDNIYYNLISIYLALTVLSNSCEPVNMSAVPNIPENVTNGDSNNLDAAFRQSMNVKEATISSEAAQTNGMTNGHSSTATWQLHDRPVENQRPLKVIVIGAGYSGIYLGIRLPERLRNCEIVIYEKNAGMGGTWYEV